MGRRAKGLIAAKKPAEVTPTPFAQDLDVLATELSREALDLSPAGQVSEIADGPEQTSTTESKGIGHRFEKLSVSAPRAESAVSQPGDPLQQVQQEATPTADEVVGQVQTENEDAQAKAETDLAKRSASCVGVSRRAGVNELDAPMSPSEQPTKPVRGSALRSGGALPSSGSRNYMQARFGHDFSQVRVHFADVAAQSAQAVSTVYRQPAPGGAGERDANGVAAGAEASVDRAAASAGAPLPGGLQRGFESSLGVDLSGVRIHTGQDSAVAASAVGAKAYTVGTDIHFAQGQYDPSSREGTELLAHEVAHTVQQTSTSARRQYKLEVSAPHDGLEREADSAARAMIARQSFRIEGAGGGLLRKDQVQQDADQGESKTMNGPAKTDIVLQVSNSGDIESAQKALKLLEDNQGLIQQGMTMISPYQNGKDDLSRIAHGEEKKLATQIPVEAYEENADVITDVELYIASAHGQESVTSEFQGQYEALTARYGRLDGVASKYCGSNLKTMQPADAHSVVDAGAAGAGTGTDQLSKTFQELLKIPEVMHARDKVESSTQELEKIPDRLSDDMNNSVSAFNTYETCVVNATVSEQGANSLKLRTAIESARAKGAEAKRDIDGVKDLLKKAGTEAAKGAAKAVVGAGTKSFGQWAAMLAAEGAATGGEAIAMELAGKLVIEPATKLLDSALTNANAGAGYVSDEALIDAALDAEKKKQDTNTVQAFKTAKGALAGAQDVAKRNFDTWIKTAVHYEFQKGEVHKAFTALADVIKKAAGKKGKSKEGKALAEMTHFLEEAELFVVEANNCLDTARKGIGVGSKEPAKQIPEKARAALDKIRNRKVWMAYPYEFHKSRPFPDKGYDVVTYYGAQEVNMHIMGLGMDASADEKAGKGHADGSWDAGLNEQSVNEAIPAAIPKIEGMKAKILALRSAIMSDIFGTDAAPAP
jgi:hypothetical protein